MRTWVRIGDHRSARTVFDDALAGTSEMLVTTAVLELGEITQADALQVVLFYRRHAPQKFERAAIRWLETSRRHGLRARRESDALDGLIALRDRDDSGLATLEALGLRPSSLAGG
jgi:hypothetical protein